MLDSFEILTTSGVVLWSKHYIPVGPSIVNSLIQDVFIEERTVPADSTAEGQKPIYKREKYTLKWTTAKDFGLIFVAVYQSLVQMTWIDKLLDNVRALFTSLYGEQLKKRNTTALECPFDEYFNRQVQELEPRGDAAPQISLNASAPLDFTPAAKEKEKALDEPPPMPGLRKPMLRQTSSYAGDTSTESTPIATPDTSRPSTPSTSHLLTAKEQRPGGKPSRRSRKAAAGPTSAPVSSGDERPRSSLGKASGKKNRVWDDMGGAGEEDGSQLLDYSAMSNGDDAAAPADVEQVDAGSWGQRTGKGEFVLKDLDDEMDTILKDAASKKQQQQQMNGDSQSGLLGSGLNAISGYFSNIVGGKTLTKEDLAKPLKAMEDHLLKKNVAREAAVRICDSVERDLIGVKTGTFESIDTKLRAATESALTKILTPTSSLDLLREIKTITAPSRTLTGLQNPRPYVLSIVGVNGVGKSTNLSKIAYFLLQNKYRVLIAAADTFRSGAVEQLRVHVRNLKELSKREGGEVDLFERGYGKDAGAIAAEAVRYAAQPVPTPTDPSKTHCRYEVVLIDTAGRRHNDTRLMSSLAHFADLAKPDKILMVGEALVGSDSVAQARHFNEAFGRGRGLNGFIISKCDTVGDMVGTLVSMVHATGVPVVFLGTGQHYSDLRGLRVGWVVGRLMAQ